MERHYDVTYWGMGIYEIIDWVRSDTCLSFCPSCPRSAGCSEGRAALTNRPVSSQFLSSQFPWSHIIIITMINVVLMIMMIIYY